MENFSMVSYCGRLKAPSRIQAPAAMTRIGQNQLNTSPGRWPAALRKNNTPSRTSSGPQNSSPRRIISTSSGVAAAQEAARDHIRAKQDQQHSRPIRAQEAQLAEQRRKHKEERRADDQQVQAMRDVLPRILTQQTGQDDADADEAGD